jgi:hypothetical protein
VRILSLQRVTGAAALLLATGCGGDSFSANPAAGGKGGADSAGGSSSSGGSSSGGGTTSGSGGGGGAAASTGGGGAPNGGTTAAGGAPGTGGSVVVADAGSPQTWCDSQRGALFCADFDEATAILPLLESFTNYSQNGAAFSLDNGGGVPSPPNALRIRTSVDHDVKAILTQKIAPFVDPPNKLTLEFSMRIDAGSAVGVLSGAAVAAIFTGTDVVDGAMALEIGNGPSLVAGYLEPKGTPGLGFGSSSLPGAFPQTNQWLGRYALQITYGNGDGGRTGCLQVLAGGIAQLPKCLQLPATLTSPTFVSVALGVYSGGFNQTGDVQIRFDNVVLTAE